MTKKILIAVGILVLLIVVVVILVKKGKISPTSPLGQLVVSASELTDGGTTPTQADLMNCGGTGRMMSTSRVNAKAGDICTAPLFAPPSNVQQRMWSIDFFGLGSCPSSTTPQGSPITWQFNQQSGNNCIYISKRVNPLFTCDPNKIGFDTNGNQQDYCSCDPNKPGYDVYGNQDTKSCSDVGS